MAFIKTPNHPDRRMTGIDRLFLRGMVAWFFVFLAAGAYTSIEDSRTGGAVMAAMVLSGPFLLLGSIAAVRLFGNNRQLTTQSSATPGAMSVKPRQPQGGLSAATCLAYGAIYGIFGIAALLIWGSLAGPHPTLPSKLLFAAIILSVPVGLALRAMRPSFIAWWGMRTVHHKAMRCLAAGQTSAAIDLLLHNNVSRKTQYGWFLAAYGYILRGSGLQALEAAQRSLDLCPKSPRVRGPYITMRALALLSLGAYEEALTDVYAGVAFKRAPGTLTILGSLLDALARPEHAIPPLLVAVETDDGAARLELSEAYRQLGRAADARALLQELAHPVPNALPDDRARAPLALALLGEYDAAEKAAAEYLPTARPTVHSSGLHAMIFVAAGRNELDETYRYATAMALLSPSFAIANLGDPRVSHVMAERRFRELFVACVRVREANVAIARRITGRSDE